MANNSIKFLLALLLGATLAACESNGFTGGGGSDPGDTGLSVVVTTSKTQILSSNTDTATITALVLDGNRNAVSGQTVSFSANSGQLLAVSGTTDEQGQATATLSSAGSPTVRTIIVTTQVGTARGTATVEVYGTALQISGVTSMAAGSTVLTLSAKDGGGSPVANAAIALSATQGTVTPASGTTDASGQLQVTVNTSQTTTVTASGLGVTASHTIAVSADAFSVVIGSPATAFPPVNTCTPVIATWTADGGVADGSTVNFFSSRGPLFTAGCPGSGTPVASATTLGGEARVYIKSTTVGPTEVQASDDAATVSALAKATFVSTTPAAINLSADTTVVAPNGTASLTAVVTDANTNLVNNALVVFSISGDSTGAEISPTTARTNTSGQAGASFIASSVSSASQSIEITATVYDASFHSIAFKTLNLTVGGKGLSININPSDTIGTAAENTQYYLPITVSVSDSSGGPVVGTTVTMQALPTYYGKGMRTWSGISWVAASTIATPDNPLASYQRVLVFDNFTGTWEPSVASACNNEDLLLGNADGILQTGEDRNGNGELEIGYVGAIVPLNPTTDKTDSTGTAKFRYYYGKDFASWVQMRITASANVGGSDASKSYDFVPNPASSDVTEVDRDPPGRYSPFGVSPVTADCTDPD